MSPALRLRATLAAFAQRMELELRTHDKDWGPRGWKGTAPLQLLDGLERDLLKLKQALKRGDTPKAVEQCADVANMAMMLADTLDGLPV